MVTRYNKLVRDKIPEILKQKGVPFEAHEADDEEYWNKLREKLIEEAQEFGKDENKAELADLLEVIDAICQWKGFSMEEIKKLQAEKRAERGGFEEGFILEES